MERKQRNMKDGSPAFSNMKLLATVVVVLSTSCHCSPAVVTSTCPNESRPNQYSSGATVGANEVYLDLQYPITCNGTATAWKFCYYLPALGQLDESDETSLIYSARVSVWRLGEVPFSPDRYLQQMVEDVDISRRTTVRPAQVVCRTLAVETPFSVEPGDVVGFYTTSDSTMMPLSLMSSVSTSVGGSSYVAQRASEGLCRLSPTFALNPSCLNNTNGLVMHLSLEVELYDPEEEYYYTTDVYTNIPTTSESMIVPPKASSPTRPPATTLPVDSKSNEQTPTTTSRIISNRLPPSTSPPPNQSPPTTGQTRNQSPPSTGPTGNQRPPSTGPTGNQSPPSTGPTGNQSPPSTGPTGNQSPPSASSASPTTKLSETEHTMTSTSGGSVFQGAQDNQGSSAGKGRLIIFTAVPITLLIAVILLIILILVLVIVMMKHRGRGNLLLQKGEGGHRHIGLDHFVIVSDMNSVPSGSIVSSPVSPEPFPYAEVPSPSPKSTIIENPQVSTPTGLCNPVYDYDSSSRCQTISTGEAVYEALDNQEKPCAPYLVPVGTIKMAQRCTIVDNHEVKMEGSKAPKDVKDLYAQVNKKTRKENSTGAQPDSRGAQAASSGQSTSVKDLYTQVCKKKSHASNTDESKKQSCPVTPGNAKGIKEHSYDGQGVGNVKDLYAQMNKKKQGTSGPMCSRRYEVSDDFCQEPFVNRSLKTSTYELLYDRNKYLNFYQHYQQVIREDSSDSKGEKFKEPARNVEDLYAQVQQQRVKDISENDIKLLDILGIGQFGKVHKGAMKTPKGDIDVAVKTLVTDDKCTSRVKLLQEAAIMGQFIHPNVIKLIGVTTKKEKLMLVIEFASRGDLKSLLVSMLPDPGELLAPESDKILLSFCQQIAYGMNYLAIKGFVHRDLAARNILVTQDGIVKIADFGMSRDIADETYYISQGGKIPVKWTAPEAIHYKKYSTASDVWSYGCLLYEIWSLGQSPFTDCSNAEALDKLQRGFRLPPPPGCPRAIYNVMINCWHPETQGRPNFKQILLELIDSEERVLEVPKRDTESHKLAGRVGGPLEAGENMYTDLQWKYLTYQ